MNSVTIIVLVVVAIAIAIYFGKKKLSIPFSGDIKKVFKLYLGREPSVSEIINFQGAPMAEIRNTLLQSTERKQLEDKYATIINDFYLQIFNETPGDEYKRWYDVIYTDNMSNTYFTREPFKPMETYTVITGKKELDFWLHELISKNISEERFKHLLNQWKNSVAVTDKVFMEVLGRAPRADEYTNFVEHKEGVIRDILLASAERKELEANYSNMINQNYEEILGFLPGNDYLKWYNQIYSDGQGEKYFDVVHATGGFALPEEGFSLYPPETKFWLNEIISGNVNPLEFQQMLKLQKLLNDEPADEVILQRIYKYYLGRSGSDHEINKSIEIIRGGGTYNTIAKMITQSEERKKLESKFRPLVVRAYADYLGRAPGENVMLWRNMLYDTMNSREVVKRTRPRTTPWFLAMTETFKKKIDRFTRITNSPEMDFWLHELISGHVLFDQFVQILDNEAKRQELVVVEHVISEFNKILNRDPSDMLKRYYKNKLLSGEMTDSDFENELIKLDREESYAILYQHAHYNGYAVKLSKGKYNLTNLQARGVKNNDISSVKLFGPNIKVILYWDDNFNGKSLELTSSISKLSSKGWNDEMTSCIVKSA